MKAVKIFFIFLILILTSCSHVVRNMTLGREVSIGAAQYGKAKYIEGFALTDISKENTRVKLEVDSTVGLSFDPATNSLKGLTSIELETGPMATGGLGELDPETAKLYLKAVTAYYDARKPATAVISDAKSTTATTSMADIIKTAVAKVKSLVPSDQDSFNIDTDDKTVAVQLELCGKLLQFADDTTKNAEGTLLKEQLTELTKLMTKISDSGKIKATVGIKTATVKDRKLTELKLVHCIDGKCEDVPCIGCIVWDKFIQEAE